MTGFGRASRRGGRPPAARRDPLGQPPRPRSQDPRRRGGRLLRRRDRPRACAPPSSAARSRCTSATSRPAASAGVDEGRVRAVLRRARAARGRSWGLSEPVGAAHGRARSWARTRACWSSRARRCGRRCARRVEAALARARAPRGARRARRWRLTSARTGDGSVDAGRAPARADARRLAGEVRAPAGGAARQRCASQPGFEPGRLAQEAALMAERLDVSEELVAPGDPPRHAAASCSATRGRGRPQARLRHPGDRARAEHHRLQGPGRRAWPRWSSTQGGAGEDARAGPERRVDRSHADGIEREHRR